jgi:hypothetical protein
MKDDKSKSLSPRERRKLRSQRDGSLSERADNLEVEVDGSAAKGDDTV